MKGLFVGSTRGTSCSLHYFTSMVRLGVDVVPFDPDYFATSSPIERAVARIRKGPSQDRVTAVSEKIISICQKSSFDFVFVMAENFFGADTMGAIRSAVKFPPLFLYHSHDNNFSAGICKPNNFEATLKAYDFLFTTKSQNVARYRQLGQPGSCYIASAYEPMVHRVIPDSESHAAKLGIEISFIGTYDRSRDPVFEKVGWDKLQVWGDFWRRSPHFKRHTERIHPEAVFYFEFADILGHSKISLGLLREEAGDRHTQRTFEIPACGGFQMAPRNDEIQSFFKDGEEIALYDSIDELKEKAEFYLSHESARHKIAQAGMRRCVNGGNSYMDRVKLMLETAGLESKRAGLSFSQPASL